MCWSWFNQQRHRQRHLMAAPIDSKRQEQHTNSTEIDPNEPLEYHRIKHIEFIMDGNRRYAKQRNLITHQGHLAGFDKLQQVLEWCFEAKIRVVTLFAFSLENFNRSPAEVESLMELFRQKLLELCSQKKLIEKHKVQVRIVGDVDRLTVGTREAAEKLMDLTCNNDRFILNICCPYNTRYEMKAAMQALRNDVKQKRVDVNSLNSKVFQNAYMQLPPLDVMVRTSGEKRLSDFMLWQCVDGNCRIHFVDSLWPEFERVDFENIITQ